MSGASRAIVIHSGRPYGLVLAPFLALSFALHAFAYGVYVAKTHLPDSRDSGYARKTFGRPPGEETIGDQLKAIEDVAIQRPRRYRLNYFERIILPQPALPLGMAALPPDLLPNPVVPIPPPKPVPTPKQPPLPKVPETGSPTPTLDRVLNEVAIGQLQGVDGEFLTIPPFMLRTLHDDVTRTESDFLRYPAIFVVGDISTTSGMNDLFNWAHFFHDLLHLPNIVSPPYVLAIGEAVEDPFFLTPDLAGDALKRRWEEQGFFAGPVWGDVAFDAQGEFLEGMDITKLPVPQVYVIDLDGYVRIRISGRLDQLNRDEMLDIATEIKNQWGMSEGEFNLAKIIIFQWQSNLKNDKLGLPSATNHELIPAVIPPFQSE